MCSDRDLCRMGHCPLGLEQCRLGVVEFSRRGLGLRDQPAHGDHGAAQRRPQGAESAALPIQWAEKLSNGHAV